ncbi:TPA: hypothetical protein ACGRM6_001361 [Legionella pneumophila]
MDNFIVTSIQHMKQLYNIENITAFSVVIAIILGSINLYLIRKSTKEKQDEILFNIASSNIHSAIESIENIDGHHKNKSLVWNTAAEQLSSFHNLSINIKNKTLRKCYIAKLESYITRLYETLEKIDNYLFFYGVKDYARKSTEQIQEEAFNNFSYISPNALGCIMQLLTLFNGAKVTYLENNKEINKILKPVYIGFTEDKEFTLEEINKMSNPFKNIHLYIHEWRQIKQKMKS